MKTLTSPHNRRHGALNAPCILVSTKLATRGLTSFDLGDGGARRSRRRFRSIARRAGRRISRSDLEMLASASSQPRHSRET